MSKPEDVPNPGSDEARAKGCTCPVLDNAHGRGYYCTPGVFVYTENCPLHGFGDEAVIRTPSLTETEKDHE